MLALQFLYYIAMRKNWTKNEDTILRRIVTEKGLEDWTAVADELRKRCEQTTRSGKQCRERWYNHLAPEVNKDVWSYQESLLLFESHRQLGNKWKEISLRLKGRTDNNIKNHFYSTLRRSLRRLNKLSGEKNATHQMREIKPSVLTIILKFIYDNQEQNENNCGDLFEDLKDLPKLIFQFAEFKPVKSNMHTSLREANQRKIETIFNLVQQFKECYLDQKSDGRRFEVKEQDFDSQQQGEEGSPHLNHITLSQFKPLEKTVNVLINTRDIEIPAASTKEQSCGKEEEIGFSGDEQHLMELHQPSPISSLLLLNQGGGELVVVGKHWSPRREEGTGQEAIIDEILEMNYE